MGERANKTAKKKKIPTCHAGRVCTFYYFGQMKTSPGGEDWQKKGVDHRPRIPLIPIMGISSHDPTEKRRKRQNTSKAPAKKKEKVERERKREIPDAK